MWIKKQILCGASCYALLILFVCVCWACQTHTHTHVHTYTYTHTHTHTHTPTHTHLFPDLSSTLLTPGVPVESGWAALPLTEISTCCLGTASARLISDRNQSSRHKPSSTYYVFEGAPTAHKKSARTHTHTHTHTSTHTHVHKQKKAWKQHAGCGLMFPLFMMANKVQRQKEIIWQKGRMWQCVFGGLVLLTPASETVLKRTLKARAEQ